MSKNERKKNIENKINCKKHMDATKNNRKLYKWIGNWVD